MIHRASRYRLRPTAEQEELFWQFAGVTRFVYNLALEQRRVFWRQHRRIEGRSINYVGQGREVTELRREVDWIGALPGSVLTQALFDLDRAIAAFFRGARFPRYRCKGKNDSFRFQVFRGTLFRKLNAKWGAVRIPKIGWVKLRLTRAFRGRPLSVTVSHSGGAWFASIGCEIGHVPGVSALPAVGIDRGIANTIALSTGELLSTPPTDRLERRKRRAQRALARRERGSNRYRKQQARLSRVACKTARVRADWRHKASLAIARRFGTVVLEDLRIRNMVRTNRGLARAIHQQGWHAFATVLAYKLKERGGTLIKVRAAYTSQECSACGAVDSRSRKNQARFACVDCGAEEHADINAAKNILRRGTPELPVEARGCAAGEAGTVTHALAA